jgi:TRAP-type C4-dicarboxylate transport system permease small subunit
MLLTLHRGAIALSATLLGLCRVMLVVMTAVIVALVTSRYFFSYSFPWAEELTRFLLIWMVMLAAALIQRRDDHIRVDFLAEKLPPRARAVVALVLRLLIIDLLLLLIRYGWTSALGMYITRAPALGVSMTWPISRFRSAP